MTNMPQATSSGSPHGEGGKGEKLDVFIVDWLAT